MDVFISYKSEELEIADNVREVLEKNDISCWMAPYSISPGGDYATDIPIAINTCCVFVLILSEESQTSVWIPKELGVALSKGAIVIPFHIDQSTLTAAFDFSLQNIQRIEAYGRLSQAYEELISSINKVLSVRKKNDNSNSEGNRNKQHDEINQLKMISAVRAYSDMWTDIEKLFLKPDLLKLKPYFYERSNEMPDDNDLDLGTALSLRIRDTIQYSQGLLAFVPEAYRNVHIGYKHQIMNARITQLALSQFRFEWENDEHELVTPDKVLVESIVAYSKYWTDIGDVFLERNNAKLRRYFFENADRLPDSRDELEQALIIAEMYRNAMRYSELLLDTIPGEFKNSYLAFKRHMVNAKIIKCLDK